MTSEVNRRVISSTCAIHPGPQGFCNLQVSRHGDEITLSPHVYGACSVVLNLAEARELHEFIGELLAL